MATRNRRLNVNQAVMKPSRRPRGPLAEVWGFIVWLVGVLVSLAVGFGMVDGVLGIPLLSDIADGIVLVAAGWIVVILTILGVILKIIDKASI